MILILVLSFVPSPRAGQSTEKPRIGFCVSMIYSPLLMYKRYQPLMDYLTEHTPYQFDLILCRSNREALHAFGRGKAQIALLDDISFMEASEKFKALPILKPLNAEGAPVIRSTIVVSSRSPIRTLGDLRGKRVAFGPHHSTTRNLLPHYLLWKNGIDLSEIESVKNIGNQSEVVKAVLSGTCDAGALAEGVAEKYAHLGLRILASSHPLPSLPILVRKDASRELVRTVSSALLNLDRNNPRHEETMKQWDPGLRYGFTNARTSDYQQVIRMYRSIPAGCGQRCHPKAGS